jgi:raffinose/stachyose/melibiose transport system permease protein
VRAALPRARVIEGAEPVRSPQSTAILYRVPFRRVLPYFIVPIALYVFVVLVPLVGAFYYSLNNTFNYQLTFSGLDNFKKLFVDPIFYLSLKNNLIVIAVSILLQMVPAFIIMAMMTTKLVVAKKFIQTIFFFPVVISPLVTAYIWRVMYSNQYGIINQLLVAIGLPGWQQNWLGDPKVIMVSIGIPLGWQYIGFYLILLLAGLTSIDRDLLEAAEIDGATGPRRTWYIILPLMKNTINVSLLLCLSGSIKIFDQIFALSGGGPGRSSSVLAMYAYNASFMRNDYGYGSAISVMMLVISFVIIAILTRARRAMSQED